MDAVEIYENEASETTPLLSRMDPETKKEGLGISQTALVPEDNKANKLPQFIAAISACLGAFALGNVLGWTAQVVPKIKESYVLGFYVTESEGNWMSGLMALGAMVSVVPIGWLIDAIGRKYSMFSLVPIFTVGWALIAWSSSTPMILAGRFLTGMAGGGFSLTAPVYTSEIAEPSIRGVLGTFFQLFITIGILYSYIVGYYLDMNPFTYTCFAIPLIFALIFIFIPETPYYYLKKNRREDAVKSLRWFRGAKYDIEFELRDMQNSLDEEIRNKVSFLQAFKTKAAKKALFISLGLMFFQQLSGINAVIFNTSDIFSLANSTLKASDSTIIVGAIQVIATLVSSFTIEYLGRKLMLIISGSVMCICSLALGIYFILINQTDGDYSNIGWLPILLLCVFIILFSFGYGPIPWMMVGEIFPPQIKGPASSIACVLNWFLCFIVTQFFADLNTAVGPESTFIAFAVISGVGVVFVIFFVLETKGKTLEQIQRELGTDISQNNTRP